MVMMVYQSGTIFAQKRVEERIQSGMEGERVRPGMEGGMSQVVSSTPGFPWVQSTPGFNLRISEFSLESSPAWDGGREVKPEIAFSLG